MTLNPYKAIHSLLGVALQNKMKKKKNSFKSLSQKQCEQTPNKVFAHKVFAHIAHTEI